MNTKTAYSERLKHPRWQRKRLEVFNRAGFECEHCGEADRSLHAHHLFYEKNAEPWDYPDLAFVCLCESCHKEFHEDKDYSDRLCRDLLGGDGCEHTSHWSRWIGRESRTGLLTIIKEVIFAQPALGYRKGYCVKLSEAGLLIHCEDDGWVDDRWIPHSDIKATIGIFRYGVAQAADIARGGISVEV